jgi:hypothetical protein
MKLFHFVSEKRLKDWRVKTSTFSNGLLTSMVINVHDHHDHGPKDSKFRKSRETVA